MNQPATPGVFGTAGVLTQPFSLTLGEAGGLVLLLVLSLALNAFQLYRHRGHVRTVASGVARTFNSASWLLARCMSTTDALDTRIKAADRYVAEANLLREFRVYSLGTEFMLRLVHEQLIGMAKTSRLRGDWAYSADETERIEERYGARLKRID